MAPQMMIRIPPGLEDGLEKMPPTEELAFEHGVLTRIMLAINNVLKKAGKSPKTSLRPIYQACEMFQQAVIDHHMKIEEEHVYPKFEDTELADCVGLLKAQHDEARKLIARMTGLSKGGRPDMDQLNATFRDFHDMIVAHAAWEETVLFPAMEGTWPDKELRDLREMQEDQEEKMFGKDAAKTIYSKLTELESSCGIEGLRDFTRKLK